MGKSSRRKRQVRAEPVARYAAQSRRQAQMDRAEEAAALARTIHVDHPKGMMIGDRGMQINYFQTVAEIGDAVGLQPVQADLPAESRVFAGRDAYLAELLGLLDPEASGTAPQVVVVSGMAGVGKSELVLHAAHAAVRSGWFPGGVLFAALHGDELELAQLALDGFLSAVGIPGDRVPADPSARSRLFSSVIARYAEAGKPVLVVVDNAVSAGQCELLLPAGGKAVVTSRNELAILDARPLRLPVLSDEAGADVLAGQLAESLVTDPRVADHRDDAREIARLCGGLPLALRIVAAILTLHQTRALATMAGHLRDAGTRLDELKWEDGGQVRGVRAAFDVSYRALPAERARVFRLLSVNPGPEVSTAAAAVLADLDQRAVRHHLEELAKTHLIEIGREDRWRMHDLIRIYAAEEQPYGTDRAWARLMAFYMNTANAANEHLAPATYYPGKRTFAGRTEALEWLDSEYPNLAAIALLPVRGPMFVDVALGLWRYFELRRRVNDGMMLTGQALLTARRIGDRGREARAQVNLAGLFRQARMFDAALAAGRSAVAIYRSTGNRAGLGMALNNLAGAQVMAERFEEATLTGREAAAVFRSLGDRHREGIALGHIALALRRTGQHAENIAAHRNVLAVMREADDQRGEGVALLNLGQALREGGQLDEAIEAEKEAADIFAEVGDRAAQGAALNNLGSDLHVSDRGREATPVLRQAVDVLTEIGDTHARAGALINLGQLLAEDGHGDEAITAFTGAVADYRETRDRGGEGAAERQRGQALQAAGRLDEAAEAFRAAAELFREVRDLREEGLTLSLLVGVLPEAQQEEAKAAFKRAVAVFQEVREPKPETMAMSSRLNPKDPAPTAAELRARIEAGTIDEIVPGLWVDFHVFSEHETEEERKVAEDIRAGVRKAAARTAGKAARERESADLDLTMAITEDNPSR
jgi:tetratricopeptide (TPR) repeat protein